MFVHSSHNSSKQTDDHIDRRAHLMKTAVEAGPHNCRQASCIAATNSQPRAQCAARVASSRLMSIVRSVPQTTKARSGEHFQCFQVGASRCGLRHVNPPDQIGGLGIGLRFMAHGFAMVTLRDRACCTLVLSSVLLFPFCWPFCLALSAGV